MIILSFYSHTLDGGDFVSLLYKEVDDFEAYAYHQKQFKKVTKKDLLGKWTLFLSKDIGKFSSNPKTWRIDCV